ncbi:ATP-binding protein [Mollicutes bacterium LVI A0039]|nr:ATP-binding protein [Mollicutes bacterium LVI A0039]
MIQKIKSNLNELSKDSLASLVPNKFKYLSLTDFTYGGLFSYISFVHARGIILYKQNDGIVKIDFLRRDLPNYRSRARHSLVTGMTGSGKSFFNKLRIVSNANDGCSVYNIDLQGDYKRLFYELGGENLVITDGYRINPLQLFEYSSEHPLGDHITTLTAFFLSAGTISDKVLNRLIVHVHDFYNDKFKHLLQDDEFENEDYPTFTDLYNYLVEIGADTEIVDFIHKFTYTIYAKYFNGHTNIKIRNKLINFVIVGVDEVVKSPIYHQIFNIMSAQMYKKKEDTLVLTLDEAKKYTTNELAIAHLNKSIREGRKYDSVIDLLTQSPSDLPDEIVEQIGTKIYFKQTNIQAVAKSLDKDIELIPDLSTYSYGEGIIQIDGKIYPIDILMTEDEQMDYKDIITIFDGEDMMYE